MPSSPPSSFVPETPPHVPVTRPIGRAGIRLRFYELVARYGDVLSENRGLKARLTLLRNDYERIDAARSAERRQYEWNEYVTLKSRDLVRRLYKELQADALRQDGVIRELRAQVRGLETHVALINADLSEVEDEAEERRVVALSYYNELYRSTLPFSSNSGVLSSIFEGRNRGPG
jgi:hypothetical protein